MRVRQPNFDFSNSRAHWAPVPEFAQMNNSISVGVPALERFLNRVMAMARKEITGDDEASVKLRADITTFIRQEACHTSVHEQMNQVLIRDGYDRIPELEKKIEAHYEHLLKTKSLPFLVAYCEGFETIGPASAMGWCGDAFDSYLEGADPNFVMGYRWHLLEEYEHRHVCYDTFKRIHGGYFLRIYGFFYQMRAFGSLGKMVNRYLTSVDRRGMSPEEVEQSRERKRGVIKTMNAPVLKSLLKVLLPNYKPHILPKPKFWTRIEGEMDRDWIAGPKLAASGAAE